jgi:hypothetical protein
MSKKVDVWKKLLNDLINKKKKSELNKKQIYQLGKLSGLIKGYEEKEKHFKKMSSSYTKDIFRLRKNCIMFQKSTEKRKKYIIDLNDFIKKLLKEKRISKKELKLFFKKNKMTEKKEKKIEIELEYAKNVLKVMNNAVRCGFAMLSQDIKNIVSKEAYDKLCEIYFKYHNANCGLFNRYIENLIKEAEKQEIKN